MSGSDICILEMFNDGVSSADISETLLNEVVIFQSANITKMPIEDLLGTKQSLVYGKFAEEESSFIGYDSLYRYSENVYIFEDKSNEILNSIAPNGILRINEEMPKNAVEATDILLSVFDAASLPRGYDIRTDFPSKDPFDPTNVTFEVCYYGNILQTKNIKIEYNLIEAKFDWSTLSKEELIYNGKEKTLKVDLNNKVDGQDVYAEIELKGDNTNVTEDGFYYTVTKLLGKDAGNYKLGDELNSPIYKITKATPDYTIPADLKGNKNDKLSSIELPEGFEWASENEIILEGKNEYSATFTPKDTVNYNVVDNISIEVNGQAIENENKTEEKPIIKPTTSPETSDNIMMFLIVFIISLVTNIVLIKRYRDVNNINK